MACGIADGVELSEENAAIITRLSDYPYTWRDGILTMAIIIVILNSGRVVKGTAISVKTVNLFEHGVRIRRCPC
jgi:hypothetical protein